MNPLVELNSGPWAEFCRRCMRAELEQRFERSVDLVEKEALRDPWRRYEILRTRKVLYAASFQRHGSPAPAGNKLNG